jgi:hypothetical protein
MHMNITFNVLINKPKLVHTCIHILGLSKKNMKFSVYIYINIVYHMQLNAVIFTDIYAYCNDSYGRNNEDLDNYDQYYLRLPY